MILGFFNNNTNNFKKEQLNARGADASAFKELVVYLSTRIKKKQLPNLNSLANFDYVLN